jgi:hypothetical protein
MIGTILAIIFFVFIIMACCASDSGSSNTGTVKKSNTYTPPRNTTPYYNYEYSECPSCGAPYFDGYCEECGYPDINQGWIGENY